MPVACRNRRGFSAEKRIRPPRGLVFCLAGEDIGFERAAPVGTLVQKLRAGEQFLARGRIHGLANAPGGV